MMFVLCGSKLVFIMLLFHITCHPLEQNSRLMHTHIMNQMSKVLSHILIIPSPFL